MSTAFLSHLESQLSELTDAGLYKKERLITSPQQAEIEVNGKKVINFCANNYLGLANHPEIIAAAHNALETRGFGMASVRFICGTQDIHKALEKQLSDFLGTEDTILYSSCFDANGGVFETLFTEEDAIISDALNHASIIDGIRLCKAQRFRYKNNDMADLKAQLIAAKSARFRAIVTDGVFSMDGIIANLAEICDLAKTYDAMVLVDDCHATGFMGAKGRGTPEYCNVLGRVDVLTGTFGKALGGASGGYIAGRKPVIEWLRNRSRPYLFSNSIAPSIVAGSMKALELIQSGDGLRKALHNNAQYFRDQMTARGFKLIPGQHPIVPVMLGDAKIASAMADALLAEGIYVIGFSYPVVPQGQARIRVILSAAHTSAELDRAISAFERVGKSLGVIE